MQHDKIQQLKQKLKALRNKPDKGAEGREKVNALNDLAIAHHEIDSKAVEGYARQALKLAERIDYHKGRSESNRIIGQSYDDRGRFDEALVCYRRSLNISKKAKDKAGSAITLASIATTFQNQGDLDKALKYLIMALRISEEIGDKHTIANIYIGLGANYIFLQNIEKALEYSIKALNISEKFGFTEIAAKSAGNVGACYFHLSDYDHAIEYMTKSMTFFEERGETRNIAQTLGNIGGTYSKKGDNERALTYCVRALKMLEEMGDKRQIVFTCIDIGEIQTLLGNYDSAYTHLQTALKIAKEISLKRGEMHSYETFSKLYQTQQNFQRALLYYRKYTEIENEIFNLEKSKQIAEMTTKYETEKKEKEAEIHRLKNVELRKEIRDRKKAERELNKHRKHLEKMVQERTAQLRSLTHELSLVEEKQRRKIATYLHDEISQKLALVAFKLESLQERSSHGEVKGEFDELMKILDQTTQRIRSLTFEISPPILYELGFEPAVEWLVENFGKQYGIRCKLKDDGELKPMSDDTRVLLFQSVRELLVNIAKHAQAQNVKVAVVSKNQAIQITVKDDGRGFDTGIIDGKIKENKGFGLFSIKERLDYLNGSIEIRSKIGIGTTVFLQAPLEKTKKRDAKRKR